ncbi:MAG TPA: penicillin-binding protein 2 [Rubricoccaceae bacterium]|nr:penicillin-binding protein 2 [Rubricoccaceae bacterium]
MAPRFSPSTSKDEARLRLRIFSGLVIAVVALLGVRLAHMQLLDRERYAVEAEGNAIKTNIVRPARGYVFDRNGTLLVDNQTTLSITVTPRYFDEANLPLIARLTGFPEADVRRSYEQVKARSSYQTATLLRDVPFAAFARLQEHQYHLRGIGFEESQQRRYHGPPRLSHVLGYVREVSEAQLEALQNQGYRQGDMVGITGIEREYETVLRGRPGREFVLVNVHGMEVQPYEGGALDVEPQSGYELRLTIDARTQALAESLFTGKRGGAVMMDARTGGILSMVSAPDFEPSGFSGRMTQDFVDYVWRNPAQPLFNRATQSYQPPGSTWKPFMALVGLEEGLIREDTKLFCGGGYFLGRLYRCHGGSHGWIDVKTAIQRSCNTFFFRVMNDHLLEGRRLDLNVWATWAHRFGFGVLAPLDLPDQSTGLIPDTSYFDRVYPAGWTSGYTVNLGIGQGNMGTTPLQLARYTAAIANGGTLVTPHLVREQVDPATGVAREPARPRPRRLPVSPENFRIVQRGMELVSEAGTARGLQIEGVTMAAKTGTAQNPGGKDHSVFIAYAPIENPQIAIGVIVENAGFGAQAAGPIASLMIEQYLTGRIARPELVQMVMARRSEGDT